MNNSEHIDYNGYPNALYETVLLLSFYLKLFVRTLEFTLLRMNQYGRNIFVTFQLFADTVFRQHSDIGLLCTF